jgi:small ligand-binding sensory domain FIST
MDDFNSDLVLQVVQYLNIVDSGRLAAASKRYFYLVHQYRVLRGPELVTVASWDASLSKQAPAREMAARAIPQLQTSPNLVLAFSNSRSPLSEELAQHLPPNAVILGAIAGDLQVNQPDQRIEHKSNASLMCASFPNAEILPFALEYGPTWQEELAALKTKLVSGGIAWKAMIVYACGNGGAVIDSFVSTMQEALPDAAIVGGICSQGYVSRTLPSKPSKEELSQKSVRELRALHQQLGGPSTIHFVEKSELVDHIYSIWHSLDEQDALYYAEDTIFGVVLGGDAPVRSMVSRGVRSVTYGVPQSSSPYMVDDVLLAHPDDDEYIFRGDDLKPIHMIRRIHNTETGKLLPATELMAKLSSQDAEFIGIKRPGQDGFELHMLSPYCQATQSFLIMTDGSPEQEASLQCAEIDFFTLNGDACLEDMDVTVQKLKEQTQGDEILGAIMFSCSGRGPERGGLIHETMADATRFSKIFPEVPCLGFYAGGEVGPLALAGNKDVFQTGRAAVQGFTAVFALFIVPVVESRNYHLDDCRANVVDFVQTRLSSSLK